jgi:hypothetical protein
LAIAGTLAVALAVVARSVNRPPVFNSVEAGPQPVARGGSATVSVNVQDPDGEPFKLDYKVDVGTIVPAADHPHRARYTAPAEASPLAAHVTVTATDERAMHTTTTIAIAVEGVPATPAPTPEPTLAPIGAATVAPRPTATPKPTRSPPPPTAPPPPTSAPPQRQNRPPILQEGTSISELGENPIVLVATGNEPDGEPITFSWDFGPCLESKNVTQFEAEVKLIGECSYAVATLTWSDPQGATATAQWQINR